MRRLLCCFLAFLALLATSARAQQTVSTLAPCEVVLEPSAGAKVITVVPLGAVLAVVAATPDWLQVKLPKDPSGFERVGYIRRDSVKDLSVAESAPPKDVPVRAANSGLPVVAVRNFDYGAVKQQWAGVTINVRGNRDQMPVDVGDVGRGISNLLVEELLQVGGMRLIERSSIEDVLKEQDLANSDRASVSAKDTTKLRQILGANFLIMGSVTKFGGEQKTKGGFAGALAGHLLLGGFQLKNTKAYVNITARIVDASSGEILGSATGQGESKRTGMLLGGMGGGPGGIGAGGIDMGSSDFRDSILGEATAAAVKDMAKQIAEKVKALR